MARGGQRSMRRPPPGRPFNEEYFRRGPAYDGLETKQRIIVDKPVTKQHIGEVKGGKVGILRFLAGSQLVGGLILFLFGIIHVALGPYNRALAMLGGMSVLWCPLGAIATGVIGLFLTRRNTRDFVCLRRGFMVMSLLNAFFFMLILILTVGLIQIRLLNDNKSDISSSETIAWYTEVLPGGVDLEVMTPTAKQGYLALSVLLLVFALLEMLMAVVAAIVIVCGPEYYFIDAQPERMAEYNPYSEPEPPRATFRERPPRVMEGPEMAVVPYRSPTRGPESGEHNAEYEAYVDEYYKTYYDDYEKQVAQMKQPNYRWVLDQGNPWSEDNSGYDDMPRRFRGATRSIDDYGVSYNPRGRYWRNQDDQPPSRY